MRRAAVCLILASIWTSGCAPSPGLDPRPGVDVEAERQAVLQADREFMQETAERGVEAWVSYFSEDGAMLPATGEVVRGHAAIRALMAPAFEIPGYTITWDPTFAEVSEGGDLAYTFGNYETTVSDAEGNRMATRGRYVTVWRKQDDGSWKVVLDMGNTEDVGQE